MEEFFADSGEELWVLVEVAGGFVEEGFPRGVVDVEDDFVVGGGFLGGRGEGVFG